VVWVYLIKNKKRKKKKRAVKITRTFIFLAIIKQQR